MPVMAGEGVVTVAVNVYWEDVPNCAAPSVVLVEAMVAQALVLKSGTEWQC